MKKIIFSTFVIIFLFFNSPNEAKSEASKQSVEAFSKLKSLVGVWTKNGNIQDSFQIEFSLTARDSVLIETWRRNGKVHSLTLYHQNFDQLLATHYCPQGNQPRLSLAPESTDRELSFTFFDATNLASLDDSHQHSLGFELPINNGSPLVRKESYLDNSGEHKSSLIMKRVVNDN